MGDTVKDVMIKDVVTLVLTDNLTVYDAVKIIAEKKVGCVVIVDNENRPIGIITEKDIVRKVIALDKDLKKTKVKDVMSTPLYTITPDVSIFYAVKIMQKRDFRRLPITQNGKLIGLVTESILTKYLTKQRMEFYKKLNIPLT